MTDKTPPDAGDDDPDATAAFESQPGGRPVANRHVPAEALRRIAELTGTQQFRDHVAAASGLTAMQQRIAELTGTQQFRDHVAAASGLTAMQQRIAELTGTQRFRDHVAAASGLTAMQQRIAELAGTQRFRDHVASAFGLSEATAGLRAAAAPDFARRARRAVERIMPRNLRGVKGVRVRDLTQIMDDEGIPFCLVPDGETVVALLEASDAKARRSVLVARFDPIFGSCEQILQLCVKSELIYPGAQLREAMDAYRGGYRSAAQSLATTVLDSTFRSHESVTHRAFVVGAKTRPGGLRGLAFVQTLDLARGLVLRPLVRAHAKPDLVSGSITYSRNATTHEVSPEQYTDANAVQAIMLATSVLGFVQGLW